MAEEIIALDPNYPAGYRTLAFVEINNCGLAGVNLLKSL